MIGYHVTTTKKLERYLTSGCILPPVRFWPDQSTAERWRKRVNRDVVLKIDVDVSYPLPDHKPARWTNEMVRNWDIVKNGAIKEDEK